MVLRLEPPLSYVLNTIIRRENQKKLTNFASPRLCKAGKYRGSCQLEANRRGRIHPFSLLATRQLNNRSLFTHWQLVLELFCGYIGAWSAGHISHSFGRINISLFSGYIGDISDPLGRLRFWLFWYLLQCCICICKHPYRYSNEAKEKRNFPH